MVPFMGNAVCAVTVGARQIQGLLQMAMPGAAQVRLCVADLLSQAHSIGSNTHCHHCWVQPCLAVTC